MTNPANTVCSAHPHGGFRKNWPAARLALALPLLLGAASALSAVYTDRLNGFAVTPPAGWQRSDDPGAAASFTSPKVVNGGSDNINVVVKDLPVAVTLDEFNSLSSEEVAKAFPGSTKGPTRRGTVDGRPAASTVYTLPIKGRTLVSVQTVVTVGKRVYVLTGTTTAAGAQAFSAVNVAFVKSFRFLK